MRPLRLITFTADAATIAAQARGSFARHDIELALTETPNSTVQMRGLSHGEYDVASTAFDNVLAWSGREGAEIVAIIQLSPDNMLPMYVRPEIADFADLRGRKLAADAVDTAFALVLRRILLAHDLDLDRGDYELVAVGAGGPRLESLKRGETFAAMLGVQQEAAAKAAGLRRITDHREVLPDYPGGVFAVNRAWAEANRGLVVDFLRAWLESAQWVRANPDAAVELMVQHGATRDAATDSVTHLSADGALNVPGLQCVLDLRTMYGFKLPMGADLAPYYDLSYYSQAAQAGQSRP
jgi:ABC-type nitrate/sulfonate/bicarbonate transport system substrate-binding protein